jgi:hypothetical protein
MTFKAIILTGLTEHIYSMIPGSSIRSLDAKDKKNFSALKRTRHFTLIPAVARTRRWKKRNPLKRQITSIRAPGVTSSFLIATSFYRPTVDADVIAAPDHVQRHTHKHTTHSVILLWTSYQPVADSSTDKTQHSQQIDVYAPAGFETAFPASKRPQTRALNCSVMA